MKVKHIAGVCGIATGALLVGGLVVSGNVFANVTYQNNTRVEFTFNPLLALTLSPNGFVIDNLLPGTSQNSNQVTATVATNNAGGYTLSATVGNATYNSTSLISGVDTIDMISGATTLAKGTWGYTLNNGTTYGALDTSDSTVLNKTTDSIGSAAYGYTGTAATNIKIGAYADDDQASGTYQNVMNFQAVANPLSDNMQNLAPELCTSTPTVVMDTRDGQNYTIARLADGNCWMLENLRLDPTEVSLDNLVYTTNATPEVLEYFKNGGGTDNDFYPESGVFAGNSYELTYPVIDALEKDVVVAASGNAPAGKVGVYYNYCAASAGSLCSGSEVRVGNAQYDICPAGWKMPKGSSVNGSYDYLYSTGYHSNAADFMAALNTPLSGGNGVPGEYGKFWSSNSITDYWSGMRTFEISSSSAFESDADRTDLLPVRCILDSSAVQDPIDSVGTMQQLGTMSGSGAMIDDMGVGDVHTLTDNRDSEQYAIAKLADGRVWMLDNLRLDPTSVSLSTLRGSTNAPDNVLGYFKDGGGAYPYPATGVTDLPELNGFDVPYIDATEKNTLASERFGNGSGKIGVKYNFCAASAGSYCPPEGASPSNAGYDVCPTGWGLPEMGSYSTLINDLYPIHEGDLIASFQYALSTPAGSIYWETVPGGDTYQTIRIYPDYIDDYLVYRADAISIRCVLR